MGVPNVTSNLSGYGRFMEKLGHGMYVVDRRRQSVEESAQQLAQIMAEFTTKSEQQRVHQRDETRRVSGLLDWETLGEMYHKARLLALQRTFPDDFPEATAN